MKIIVVGATGFVGTDVIRQALSNPTITSIVALARRETSLPQDLGPDADASKLKSVTCDDFMNYSESVKQELADADACIWLMAVTPTKSREFPWEEVRKICLDYTVAGLETISKLPRDKASKPLRFVYTSGSSAERDPTKKPWIIGDYCLLRGEVENHVLEFAKSSNGLIEVCIAKPGLIRSSDQTGLALKALQAVATSLIGLPIIELKEMSAALLHLAIKGPEKETFTNEDLARIGKEALAEQQKSS